MNSIGIRRTLGIAIVVVGLYASYAQSADSQPSSRPAFDDEPAAHALYDKMVTAIRQANTLSYQSDYSWEANGLILGRAKYTIWMKKPNYWRLEAVNAVDEKRTGVIVGDGNHLWLYWPNGRPRFSNEHNDKADESTSHNVYMKKPTPVAAHSIAHETPYLGVGMGMTILNPSTFHGYTGSLQEHIDAVRGLGTARVGSEECDVIDISIMKGQRSWRLWLAKRDHLPRKLKQVVRVTYDIIFHEQWSNIIVNADIANERFAWKPPADWKQWKPAAPEESLLKVGTKAPDFEYLSTEAKKKIKLSDYRGKVVWLFFWRVGCPPCRQELPILEELYRKYEAKGLVILGFNCSDDKETVLEFLRENSVTFPNILDSSAPASRTAFQIYGVNAVPINYIIDEEGVIADVWCGYDGREGIHTKGVLSKLESDTRESNTSTPTTSYEAEHVE